MNVKFVRWEYVSFNKANRNIVLLVGTGAKPVQCLENETEQKCFHGRENTQGTIQTGGGSQRK